MKLTTLFPTHTHTPPAASRRNTNRTGPWLQKMELNVTSWRSDILEWPGSGRVCRSGPQKWAGAKVWWICKMHDSWKEMGGERSFARYFGTASLCIYIVYWIWWFCGNTDHFHTSWKCLENGPLPSSQIEVRAYSCINLFFAAKRAGFSSGSFPLWKQNETDEIPENKP